MARRHRAEKRQVLPDPKFGEILDERHYALEIDFINATNEANVVETRKVLLEGSAKRKRPRHRDASPDSSRCWQLGAADHPNEGGLSRSVAPEDANFLASLDLQINSI